MAPLSEPRVDSWSESLGPGWLQERLPHYLWQEDERTGHVADVRIVQKRATSNEDAGSLILVAIRQHDGTLLEQMYTCSECADHELRAKYEGWLATDTIAPTLGPPVILIPEANLLLVAFPNDRRMRLLTTANLEARLADHATAVANGGREGPPWRVKEIVVRLLRYAPGERLTVSCRGVIEAEDGTERAFAYVAKQFGVKDRAKALYRNLVSLDKHLAASRAVRLPRAVAFDGESGLVVMEELAGQTLNRVLHDVDLDQVMPAVGEMLATLHQAPRRVRETISPRMELQNVRKAAKAIGGVVPSMHSRLDACVARCLAVRWTDEVPRVLLHGAFRLGHVIVHDGRLALVDVDGLRMGHPGYDVGHFLSSLYYLEVQGRISTSVRKACAQRFLQAYAARAPWRLSPVAVLWFAAALLIHKQARKYALHLRRNRREKIDHVLTLTEAALAGCEALRDESSLEAIWRVLP